MNDIIRSSTLRPSDDSLRVARAHVERFLDDLAPGERLTLRSARMVHQPSGQGARRTSERKTLGFKAVELAVGDRVVEEVLIAATATFALVMEGATFDLGFVPFMLAATDDRCVRFTLRPAEEEPS